MRVLGPEDAAQCACKAVRLKRLLAAQPPEDRSRIAQAQLGHTTLEIYTVFHTDLVTRGTSTATPWPCRVPETLNLPTGP